MRQKLHYNSHDATPCCLSTGGYHWTSAPQLHSVFVPRGRRVEDIGDAENLDGIGNISSSNYSGSKSRSALEKYSLTAFSSITRIKFNIAATELRKIISPAPPRSKRRTHTFPSSDKQANDCSNSKTSSSSIRSRVSHHASGGRLLSARNAPIDALTVLKSSQHNAFCCSSRSLRGAA
jgi:hypothetical protein